MTYRLAIELSSTTISAASLNLVDFNKIRFDCMWPIQGFVSSILIVVLIDMLIMCIYRHINPWLSRLTASREEDIRIIIALFSEDGESQHPYTWFSLVPLLLAKPLK